MPDEEPQQRPDAAASTAPAKKAPARKAPAKKAAAKKAPAKRAAKRPAPRATIMNRIQELEERMSGEPVEEAPPAPLITKPRMAEPAPEEPADETQAIAVAPAIPVLEAPVVLPEPPPPALPPALPRANPRSDLVVSDEAVVRQRSSHERSGLDRVLAVLLVLLLSAAAGLGTAAFVRNRPSTWHAEAVVAITPPSSGSATESTSDAAVRYVKTAETTDFASDAAALGGVPGEQVKGEFKAREGKAGEVVVDTRAPDGDTAAMLAEAASRQLVLEVLKDQAERADASSRLGAKVVVPTTHPTRLQPTDRSVLLGGVLAAVDIMLVAVMVGILLQRPSRRRR
jgi:hypothetical protein